MAFMPELTLYYMPTCPYCRKVLAYMQDHDIAMEMRNTMEPGIADELVELAGTAQVPCLIINGSPMLESDDIIAYLAGVVAAGEIG